MKICLAQTKPVKGDIEANITNHLELIHLAIANRADTIIFPELSITGYEPTLANELATTPEDNRFAPFQQISDANKTIIGIGVPIKTAKGITISLLLFQPNRKPEIYAKQYLHPDEEPFFVGGQNTIGLIGKKPTAALAICYELSVPEHAEAAFRKGAQLYIASVAKSAEGIEKAMTRLAEIARNHSMFVSMANCIGWCDGMLCGGRSAVWNTGGELITQLDDNREGILLLDTETGDVVEKYC